MSKISSGLTVSTIANMLATEIERKNIPIAEDEDLRYNIIYGGAELISFEDGVTNDIQLCVERVKEYIINTLKNYPNYFLTGEGE